MKYISRLHYITTSDALAEQACQGGADWIQLRLKDVDFETYAEVAMEVKETCKKYGATFIINDNVSLALDTGADGVHLGRNDMPPSKAREILGDQFIIGSTANTLEDIIRLSNEPIDYIGLGPFRFTTTKQNLSPIIGLEGYEQIFTALNNRNLQVPPVIAIGGIALQDIDSLLAAGLHGVAVSGAITNASDPVLAAKALRQTCRQFNYITQ
ncbi:thiamine phosphate synthase [Chitinophagaceae bacterium MMS25-I14]